MKLHEIASNAKTLTKKSKYKKNIKKFQNDKVVMDRLFNIVNTLLMGQLLSSLSPTFDHSLTGNRKGSRDCHIKPDVVLIYRTDPLSVILEDIGSHTKLVLTK